MFLSPLNIWEIFGALLWFTGVGLIFSIVSQMGFFAYLWINQFGLSLFRSLWNPVQIILIAFVLFDLVYFRFNDAPEGSSIVPYLTTAAVLFVFGYAVSYVKAKETNKRAFIPALFFMIVVTTIEWIPVLRTNDPDWMMLMIVPLLVCNTYQLLVLHRIVGFKTQEQQDNSTVKQTNVSKSNKKKKK